MRSNSSITFIVFLLALSVSGPLSINFYLALLPKMAGELSVDAATIQKTVSIYLAGFAGAQLIIGPLSDIFGRRPVLIFCYILFSLSSLVCAISDSAYLLIFGRFVQSLGGCAGVLISRAIVRDVFSPSEMGRIMSYMITGFSMAPLIAPTIGGFIGINYGWRSLFYIFSCIGVSLVVWTYFGFKETNNNLNQNTINLRTILGNYFSLLKNRCFLCYFFIVSSSVAGILTYTSASSFVLIEVLEVPSQYYGLLFSITALGMFLGSLLSANLSSRFGSALTTWYGCLVLLSGGLLLAILPLVGVTSVLTLVGSMFIYALGNGVVMPSAMASAILPFPNRSGSAAALIGCFQAALGAVCGYIAGLLYDKTAIPMTSIIGLLSLIAFFSVFFIRISEKKQQFPRFSR